MKGKPAAPVAPLLFCLCAAVSAAAASEARAPRALTASDHAELHAEIAADGLVRVALLGDRVARTAGAPNGFSVAHDAGAGDIYLRRLPNAAEASGPAAFFIGSERGFTYRLRLLPVAGGAAQLLIRNPAIAGAEAAAGGPGGDAHVAEIAALIRAAANRKPPPGYAVAPGVPVAAAGVAALEIWRGPRFEVWLLALDPRRFPGDAKALARRFGAGTLAAWIDGAGAADARPAAVLREGRGGTDHAER